MTFPQPPFPLAFLPNEHGFEFIGVRSDGSRVECRVERGPDGLHRIADGRYAELVGFFCKVRTKKAEGAK